MRVLPILLLTLLGVGPIRASDEDLEEIRDLAASGRSYEALARLEPLLGAEPDEVEGLMLKGVLLTRLDRVDEAREIFLSLISSSPELPEPYINLAALYAGAGDYDRAVQTLKRALATHPSYLAAYENLTKVYGKLASEAYRQALGDQAEIEEEPMELVLLDRLQPRTVSGAGATTGVQARAAGTAPPTASVAASRRETEPERPSSGVEPGEVATAEVVQADSAPIESEAAITVKTAAEPAVDEEVDRGERTEADLQQVPEMIDGWALAWTEQRVEDYLHFYSARFEPSNGLSRDGWEVLRRGRLSGPTFISISVQDLEVEREGSGRATARFVQLYDSNVVQDSCVKALSLIWEDGGWKIADERIEE